MDRRFSQSDRWWRVGLGLLVGALALLVPVPAARAQESLEEVDKRIGELAGRNDLTEAEVAELTELLNKYNEISRREGEQQPSPPPAGPPTPQPAPTAAPAPTPAPGAPTPTPRRTPRRTGSTATRPGGPAADNAATSRPSRTPAPGAATPGGTRPAPAPAAPKGPTEAIRPELNVDVEKLLRPYDEREYVFSIKDGSFAELVEAFSRMSGLPVIGDAPAGTTTFVCDQPMDFKTALGRVQMKLFNHPEIYWIYLEDGSLEVRRLTDIPRHLRLQHMYRTVEDFRAADLSDNELAILVYVPDSGSIADLEPLRDFMPDYVRVAPLGDENAIWIFALVRDINKYLELTKKFDIAATDPRKLETIAVEHILPTQAIDTLRQLMDGFDGEAGAPASQRKPGQPSEAKAKAQRITAIPDDELNHILVLAMPAKIAEMRRLLTFIDVDATRQDFAPVVVKLQHAKAGQVLSLVRPILDATSETKAAPGQPPQPAPPAQPAQAGKRTRRPAGGGAAATVSSEKLTMIEWAPANAIVLVGEPAQVERAQGLIAQFDVPDDTQVELVRLEHADPDQVAATLLEMLKAVNPAVPSTLICKSDPANSAVILSGPPNEIAQAKAMIAKIDVTSDVPQGKVHSIRLANARPSALLNILNAWESGTTPAPAAATPQKGRPRRPTPAAPGSKFQADDALGLLYVICTDDDWEQTYRPMIEKLDSEAVSQGDYTSIPVGHVTPEELIAKLQPAFAAPTKGGAAPVFIAAGDKVLVLNATSDQVASMKRIAGEVDTESAVERRIFTLANANAAEVVPIVQSTVGTGAPPRKGQPAPGSDVRMVPAGTDKIVVWAPPRVIKDIADLIAELDAPDAPVELKTYDFPASANLGEITQTLSQLFQSAGAPGRTPRAPRSGKGQPAATPTMTGSGVLFVPQPAQHRLVVSAPKDMIPSIEEVINVLRQQGDTPPAVVKFVEIKQADPEAVTTTMEPILAVKVDELVASGAIPVGAGGKGAAAKPYSLQADPAGKRIIYAGPSVLFSEIESLVAELDTGEYAGKVMRRVVLKKADAEEMAGAIGAILTGQRTAPARKGGAAKGRPGKAGAPAAQAVQTGDVTVVPAPGGNALVLTGLREAVDEVEGWIKELDDAASESLVVKVYRPYGVDVERLADEIMTMIDSGGGAKAAPAAKSKSSADSLFGGFDDFFDSGGPRKGTDISLTTDYYSNTMVVRAPPRLIKEIDEWVAMYEEGGDRQEPPPWPSRIVQLNYADPYDAEDAVDEYIKAMWDGRDKPKVDRVYGQSALVVKSKNEADLDKLQDLVKQVDKPTIGGAVKYATVPVSGLPADKLLKALELEFGEDIEVDTASITPSRTGPRIKQLRPEDCVLPASMVAAVNAIGPVVSALGGGDNEIAGGTSPDTDKATRTKKEGDRGDTVDRMVQALISQAGESLPAEKTGAGQTPSSEARPKLKIKIDPRTGSIEMEGPTRLVEKAKKAIEDIQKEVDTTGTGMPDIRVWQLKHLDPNVASQVLETMFNAAAGGAGRMTPQQRQMQAQIAAQMEALRAAQAGQPAEERGKPGQPAQPGQPTQPGQPGTRGKQQTPVPQVPVVQPQAPSSIRVFPYPAQRAIIIAAPTEMYPALEELLATIDKPTDTKQTYRFFRLANQRASDVEKQLKTMLGLEARSQPTPRMPRGGQPDAAAAAIAEMMRMSNLPTVGGEEASLTSGESITITSNDVSNTVMAMAPENVLDLIEKIIEDLESQTPPPIETRVIPLQYADAPVLVPQLQKLLSTSVTGGGKGAAGFHPDDITAVLEPDAVNNAVIVRALETDMPKITELIAKLDVQSTTQDRAISAELTCGDAVGMAKTLETAYSMGRGAAGGKGGGGGAKKTQFVGDASSNTLFFTAPPELREDITKKIAEMDEAACAGLKPKFIDVQHQVATVVAKAIEGAFGAGGKGRKDAVKVTADDATGRLMVICPDALLPQVEQLARDLDVDPKGVELQVFQLQYARAPEVLQKLNEMVRTLMQQISGKNVKMDPFSASADERSNSIIVVGGPTTFALVKQVLEKVDVEAVAPIRMQTKVIALTKARAAEVAATINALFRDKRDGIDPPRAEANGTTNTVLIRGTDAQLAEIEAQVIQPLEQFATASPKLTEEVINLTYIQSDEAVTYLNEWFQNRKTAIKESAGQGIDPSELTMTITAMGSKQIIVNGSPNTLAKVHERLVEIDKEGVGKLAGRETKVTEVLYADPTSVVNIIKAAFPSRKNAAEKDIVDASIETATRSVVVTANRANQELVAALIKDVDRETGGRQVHVVPVKYADPASVVKSLTEVFAARMKGQPGDTVTISNPQGSESLLIKANDNEFKDISQVLTQLDVLPSDEARGIKAITLEYTDAQEMKTILEDYLRKPGAAAGGKAGQELVGNMRINAVTSTNSLTISGDEEGIARIAAIVEQLDVAVDDPAGGPRIIRLQKAIASEVEPTLAKLFVEADKGRAARGGKGGAAGTQMTPVIVADDATNTLIVRANATDYGLIERLVEQLDQEEKDVLSNVRVIKVAPAFRAEELASSIEQTLRGAAAPKGGKTGGKQTEVTVASDPVTNSIIVSGDPKMLEVAEALVRQLEQSGPSGGRKQIMLDLKNLSPEDAAQLIQDVSDKARGGGSSGSSGRRPSSSTPRRR